MSWYGDEKPVEISHEEVGYDPEWGEHHGLVKTKRDTWNYGQLGYDSYRPPMPLPKKLYHVTPFPEKVLAEGLKNSKDTGNETFGGHGTYISFTSLKNAKIYQDALQDYIRLANLEFESWSDFENKLSPFIQKWEIRPGWISVLKERYIDYGLGRYQPELVESMLKRKPELADNITLPKILGMEIGIASHYSGKGFPIFISSKTTFPKFKGFSPTNVKIIEVETSPLPWHSGTNMDDEDKKMHYNYVKGENEWRIWDNNKIRTIHVID